MMAAQPVSVVSVGFYCDHCKRNVPMTETYRSEDGESGTSVVG